MASCSMSSRFRVSTSRTISCATRSLSRAAVSSALGGSGVMRASNTCPSSMLSSCCDSSPILQTVSATTPPQDTTSNELGAGGPCFWLVPPRVDGQVRCFRPALVGVVPVPSALGTPPQSLRDVRVVRLMRRLR
eukprot:CAMPEP_0175880334 /NCGR_PEP_ID=MMETSP0107_2-20121207/42261_1 /TAXON_ID=195067 ORGANISM="Goniomonas pacifica, Strain CCMP1869" /NCGR_SAMPLE_ID=MMETSP0107_2 /ASSEMBLY_ACC=CAM_ASM_000203 /LENGTH=133 /DNA_ID=CAMNT_0017200069 /DNA_START=1041 /DNA_END=1438 /DNA_ORIENTATION=+